MSVNHQENNEELLSQAQSFTNHSSTATWRKPGEQLRASVIEEDEATGAQAFILSSSCPIHRYYEVADKVLDQFLHHPIDTRDELLEAYMVGNRLVKFLSIILPTHGDYFSQNDMAAVEARERSQGQVAIVAKYLDQIALLIDKQEHEDYISSVLCQHQEEKSNKIASLSDQQREHMYYSDDTDDDCHDINKYLATNHTGGSDSTERLNNTSNSSACNTMDSADQHRRLPPTYRKQQHDTSVVSDSVDLLLEGSHASSRNVFLRDDPASTPAHTILRVSHTNEAKALAYSPHSKKAPVKTQQMPMVRSHWVANQPTKQTTNANAMDTSFSSVDRSLDNTESVNTVTSSSSLQRSPESSVRNIIRSWPPKQDPPGINIAIMNTSSGSAPPAPISQQPRIVQPPVTETTNLSFKPMTELQRMSADLDKESPSRESIREPLFRHKWKDVDRNVTTREPSQGSQRARFPSSSYSSSSRDRSTTTDESSFSNADTNSYREIETSTFVASSSPESAPNKILTNGVVSNSLNQGKEKPMEKELRPEMLNISLDSSGFPKPHSPKSSQLMDSINTGISVVDPISTGISTMNPIESLHDSSLKDLSAPHINRNINASGSNTCESDFDFPVDFESQQTTLKGLESADISHDKRFQSQRRGTGPVDLDVSTVSTETASQNESSNSISMSSRGFLADGIDYVLPLPKNSKKSSPVIASYAPSALDWSLDEAADMENPRFERQNSTISIHSTEFGACPRKEKSFVTSDKTRTTSMKYPDPLSDSPDWVGDWNRLESATNLQSDGSEAKALSTSDISTPLSHFEKDQSSSERPERFYDTLDQLKLTSGNDILSHSPDTRKSIIPKGNRVQRGPSCTDRTSSTGSSSTTPSKDISPDFVPPLSKTSELLDPFLSRTPVEAPFLLDEQETPFMIDSKAEQRLRVSMKSTADLVRRSPNVSSLDLSPNNVGLFGSLKGIQPRDGAFPMYDDPMIEDPTFRGRTLFCRSRPKPWSDPRSPNEDDWEDASLLLAQNPNGQTHKNCVRCLLT